MKIDLHTHSTISDGTLTPNEIFESAVQNNLEVISITDHDTIDALNDITNIPENLIFIKGVEISAEFPKTLHILGYDFDPSNEDLSKTLKELQDFRKKRNLKIQENMAKLGFHISSEELVTEAKGEIVGRPHFAKLMHKKGYVNSYQEAFDKYLAKGKLLYLNKKRLEPQKAIELILNAGGIPVLAHPYQTKLNDDELELLIKELKEYGLIGIEVFYSQHTRKQEQLYLQFASKYNLLITAGSDFHGNNTPAIKLGLNVQYFYLKKFLDKIQNR